MFPSIRRTAKSAGRPDLASVSPESSPVSTRRQLPTWAPLRSPLFRALWIASIASNIGSWMHDAGSSWLMSSLSKSPGTNSLVQAAGALPMFLFALPAGALADIVDRRKLLMWTQLWAGLVAGVLGVLTLMHLAGIGTLLTCTLLLSLGTGLTGPAWQGLFPEMVKRQQVQSALILSGISFNTSRVVGPALGGLIIFAASAYLGDRSAPGTVFVINAISFAGVVAVLAMWRREPRHSDMPPEHIVAAVKTGLRFTWHSPVLRAVLARLAAFGLCGSALFSLITLHARINLHLNAFGVGLMMACFGAGAVGAGLVFGPLRRTHSSDSLVALGTFAAAANLLGMALFKEVWLVRLAMALAGFGWSMTMTNLNVVVIRSVPDWVRSRASSMYLFVFMGSSALGSFFWGRLADGCNQLGLRGIIIAFRIGALGMMLGWIMLRRYRIADPEGSSPEPSLHWPEPVVAFAPTPEKGPVLVTVEYQIDPAQAREFVEAMQPIRRGRLRDGALRWNLFQDAAYPARWVETMLMESWNDYLRQHARVTQVDRKFEARVQEFQRGEGPVVSHLIAAAAALHEVETEEG